MKARWKHFFANDKASREAASKGKTNGAPQRASKMLLIGCIAILANALHLGRAAAATVGNNPFETSTLTCQDLDQLVRSGNVEELAAIQVWFHGISSGLFVSLAARHSTAPVKIPFFLTNDFARGTMEHLAFRCGREMKQSLLRAYLTDSKDEETALNENKQHDGAAYLTGAFDFDPSRMTCTGWSAMNAHRDSVPQNLILYWLNGFRVGYEVIHQGESVPPAQFDATFVAATRTFLDRECGAAPNDLIWRAYVRTID
jgi:hypothetical protein